MQDILNYLKNNATSPNSAKSANEIIRNIGTEEMNISTFYRHFRSLNKFGVKMCLHLKNSKRGRQTIKCYYFP